MAKPKPLSPLQRLAQHDPEGRAEIANVACLCIATTQRSGSTMVSKEIGATRVMGAPSELVQGLLVNMRRGEDLPSVADWIEKGMTRDTGVFGLKIMVSQLPLLGAWITDSREATEILANEKTASQQLSEAALAFLRQSQKTVFLRLDREDSFAQAYSRLRARKSGLYHQFASGKTQGRHEAKAFSPEDMNITEICSELTQLLTEKDDLARFLPEGAADVQVLRYEKVVEQGPGYLDDIVAAFDGRIPAVETVGQKTTKIVDNEELDRAKTLFKQALWIDR